MGIERPDAGERPTEAVDDALPTIDAPMVPAAPVVAGTNLGRYVAIEESGRGGMGSVIRAYDPKLQREVALKRLHTSRMNDDAKARLVREARAMAQLGHPNVVAVFDVESGDDVGVMVVMEFVRGLTLREWLRKRTRAWTEIVDTFVAAGRGLAAAHAVGLLHRDFKPGNVLVSEDVPGELRVRVTDFGLARPPRHSDADERALADDGEHAASESSEALEASAVRGIPDGLTEELTSASVVMGTPTYMAPEQHAGTPLSVAADQYAFCVALWEALAGKPPFVGRSPQLRVAKAKGPPPWPRDADAPRPVVAALRRGLAASPSDRWPSMDALLRELANASHAHDRKRRIAIGIGGAAIASATVWLVWPSSEGPCAHAAAQLVGVWDAERRAGADAAIAATELPYAASTSVRVDAALDEYAEAWVAMHTDACEDTSVRHEQSEAVLDARMSCLQRAKVHLDAVADMLEQADAQVVEHADRIVDGLASLSRCADVDALMQAVAPPLAENADAVDEARGRLAQVRTLMAAGKPGDALELSRAIAKDVVAIDYAPLRTETELEHGRAEMSQAQFDVAVASLQLVLREAPALHQWDESCSAAIQLGQHFGDRLGRPDVGLAYLDTARGLCELSSDPDDAQLRTRNATAAIHVQQGKYAEAEREFEEILNARLDALGEDDPKVAHARAELARGHRDAGHYPEAEAQYRLALASQERVLGPDHPAVANIRNNLAVALTAQDKYAEAEAELQRTLEVRERVFAADHPDSATTRTNLAEVYNAQGRYADAERELEHAMRIRIAAFGEEHPDVAAIRNNLVGPLVRQGKHEEAERELRAALASWEAALGSDHPDVALARGNLAALLTQRGEDDEAVQLLRRALPVWERALGPEHPDVALGHSNLGRALYHLSEYAESERELRGALARQVAAFGAENVEVAATRQALALTLGRLGETDEAIAEARKAVASCEAALPDDHPDLARVQRTLGALLLDHDGDLDEATRMLEAAWRVLERDQHVLDDRAGTAFDLGRAYWMRPAQRDRARELVRVAAQTWASDGQKDRVVEAETWLREHP